MIPTRWWWIRHAPVTSHGGRVYGQNDLPADCADEALFRGLAAQLPGDALWLVTPLRRTRQTAEALFAAGAPQPAELREEPDFLEQHFGSWQGLTYDELAALRDGAAHRFWHAPAVGAAARRGKLRRCDGRGSLPPCSGSPLARPGGIWWWWPMAARSAPLWRMPWASRRSGRWALPWTIAP